MAISNTFWDESKPVDGLLIPDIPQSIRFLVGNVEALLGIEHHTFPTDSNSGAYHSQGSAVPFYQSSAPATRADSSAFAAADLGRLWVDSDDQRVYMLTATTPSWTEIALPTTVSKADPTLTLVNTDAEDTDGGRQSQFIAKGTQSGDEETTLGLIEFSHEGSSDDQKGQFILKLNDGDDDDAPSKQSIGFQSTGKIDVANSLSILDEDDMTSDDAEVVPTQQSVKAFTEANGYPSVNGTPTAVFTKYFTGTLDSDASTAVAHGVTTGSTKILSVTASAFEDTTFSKYMAYDNRAAVAADEAFTIIYDDTHVIFTAVGEQVQGNGYKVKVDYIL